MHLDLLLLGKLLIQNGNYSFEFELVRGSDAVHLASFQYSGTKDELTTIRDKVQRDVYSKLQATNKPIQTIRGSTQNPQAYSYYLNARELVYQRTIESSTAALQQYESAIRLDPGFARAYAGLATAHVAHYNFTRSQDDHAKAKQAAEKALQLDPDLAEAHAVLGLIAFHVDWNFVAAEGNIRHALALEPHQALYHAWLANLLSVEGRFDESLHEISEAHADDPHWPFLYVLEISLAGGARDYGRALDAAEKYDELVGHTSTASDYKAWAFFQMGSYEQAIAEWHSMAVLEKDETRMLLEDRGLNAFRQGGITAYAAVRLDASLNGPGSMVQRHPLDFVPAEWYAVMNDRDHAIAELEQAVAQRAPQALDIVVNPMFENLHDDPRFLALLAHAGLKLHPKGKS
jgi:tetratricopeptide (TPR) repeat protein